MISIAREQSQHEACTYEVVQARCEHVISRAGDGVREGCDHRDEQEEKRYTRFSPNECCDVGLSELEAMSVLAGPRLRAGDASALSEARFHKSVKSGRGAPRAFDRAVCIEGGRWGLRRMRAKWLHRSNGYGN